MNRITTSLLTGLAVALPGMLDATLKGAVILAFIAMLVLCMRKSTADARHLAWLLGIVALLLLPLLSAALPGWSVLPAWATVPLPAIRSANGLREEPTPPLEVPLEISPAALPLAGHPFADQRAGARPPEDTVVAMPLPTAPSREPYSPWLGTVWLAGLAFLLMRMAGCALLLRNAARRAELVTDGRLRRALDAACSDLNMRRRVRLLVDQRRIVPLVWGIGRARLVLPEEAREWDDSRLRAVLLHEVAHIKRGDLLVVLLARVACAVHWFNPLAWLAAWRLHTERERACDDLVLRAGVRPSDYAEHLLHVATRLEAASPASALAMARPSRLEGRLLAVLNQRLRRGSVKWPVALLALAFAVAITIPMAMLRGQEEKAAEPGARGTGSIDVIQRTTAATPPVSSDVPPAPVEGTVQHTNRAGRWLLGGGVIMDVHQNIYHGADVTSNGVLWWPARPDRPALRHEFSLASDAFANRVPWRMAWEANGTVLWIAIGESRFLGRNDEKKHVLARVRRLDFSDPAAIKETHWAPAGPTPVAIHRALATDFEISPTAAAGNEHVYPATARLEHTWILTGTTRNHAGQPLGNVPIALHMDGDTHPFEQTRSDPNGRFWTSARPPFTALNRGCTISVRGNRIDGHEPPPDFQESRLQLKAEEIARHAEGAGPASGTTAFVGAVETAQGQARANALIAVIADGDTVSGFTTRADPQGKFKLGVSADQRMVSVLVETADWKRRGSVGGIRFTAGKAHAAKLALSAGRGPEWKLVLNWVKPEGFGMAPDGSPVDPGALDTQPARFVETEQAPSKKSEGVPVLKDIPILGPLFQSGGRKDVIDVKEDGTLHWDAQPISREDLAKKLTEIAKTNADHAVVVRAGQRAPYQHLASVLDVCKQAGLRNLAIETAPKPSPDTDSGSTASNDAIARVTKAEDELANLLTTYRQEHPRVQALRAQIDALRKGLVERPNVEGADLSQEHSPDAEILRLLNEDLRLGEEKLKILKQEQAAGVSTPLPVMRMEAEVVSLRRARAAHEGKRAEVNALFDEQIKLLEETSRAVAGRQNDSDRQKAAIDIQREILALKREKARGSLSRTGR